MRSRSRSSGSRSRSRSRVRSSDKYRRSRERSRSPRGTGYRRRSDSRSRSKSPLSDRKRHMGRRVSGSHSAGPRGTARTADDPQPSKCLGIFGLSTRTSERDVREIFERYPGFVDAKLIMDYGSGVSRGFGFLNFESVDDARYVKDKCVGMDIDGRSIRIDFSTTQRAHTPTPGRYMGTPSFRSSARGPPPRRDRDYRERDYYRDSRDSYRRRTRSRSYSPRRR